jgi:hypothetical protein
MVWIAIAVLAYFILNANMMLKEFAKRQNNYIDINKELHSSNELKIKELEDEVYKLKRDNFILRNVIKEENKAQKREHSLKMDVEFGV